MTTILHIVNRQKWEAAKAVGPYRGDTLDSEGFIHCCATALQMDRVANKYYRDQANMVLLHIDTDRLTSKLVYESPKSGATVQGQDASAAMDYRSEQFPHIYGPLNIDAVNDVESIAQGTDGLYHLG